MKAEAEDRLDAEAGGGGFPTKYVVLVVVIIALLLLFWMSRGQKDSTEPSEDALPGSDVTIEQVEPPPAPDIPPRPEAQPSQLTDTAEIILPDLADSDDLAREQLAAAGSGSQIDKLASSNNIVQLGAALVDAFSRGLVMYKLLPVDPPKGSFSVEQQGDQTFMGALGYKRYDGYARTIAELDADALVNAFHTLRPLFEQAYGQLGMRPEDFDNALIRMLDQVLATPEIDEPIPLTRTSVMWRYADPALEKLSDLQKQLLRMGPDNIRRIKKQARSVRAGLLAQ